jgi:P-type conjugative transfer protein TrbG
MTDDITIPKASPRLGQRLDGPDAPLTAEWDIQDLPWITAVEDADEDTLAGSGTRAPPPPSRRTAKEFLGGAVAPHGSTGTREPLVTQPKPRQTEIRLAPVVLASDPDATLPPRDQRQPGRSPIAPRATQCATAARLERGRPSVVALGAAIGCTLGYAFWAAVLRPSLMDAAPEPGSRLPAFLDESSSTTKAALGADSPPSAAPRSTLPPELAATLAKALVPTAGSETSLSVDAGPLPQAGEFLAPLPASVPANPIPSKALPTRSAPPASDSASVEAQRHPGTLLAASEAQTPPASEPRALLRRENPAPAPSAGPRAPHELVATSSRSHRAIPRAPSAKSDGSAISAKRHPDQESLRGESRASRPASVATVRRLTTYTYEDKALFSIDTAPMRVTDLVLERGETLVSQPTAGDAARWVISVVPGEAQTHVFVKPLRPGLRTNLTLTTTRRTYFLELSSHGDGTYMAGVEWQYPGDDAARHQEALAQAERERQGATAVADLQALRFDYRIQVAAGDPSWKPTMVFDDGRKTFIRFPRRITGSASPILLIPRTGTTKDAKYVNYRVKNDLYVVDYLFDSAELRLPAGDSTADVVRITRKH